MANILVLSVDVSGENVMGNPLLKAHGFWRESGKNHEIRIETPITSIKEFVAAFNSLFTEEK